MMNNNVSTSSASQILSALSDQVKSADLMGGGLVISFENGKTAVYSAALLKQMCRHAREITNFSLSDA
jgi:hypothetical protein